VTLYAAYGSNMEPAQMMQRAPHSPMAGTGWLEGWRLTFGGEDLGWEGALATIVEDAGSRVFVVLYDVTLDEDGLDRWEGGELGMHNKIRLRVQTMDGSVLAWLYVLDGYEGGSRRRPRRLRRRPAHPPLHRHHRLVRHLCTRVGRLHTRVGQPCTAVSPSAERRQPSVHPVLAADPPNPRRLP
jgi:AIG2-like family